jgi:lipopolysaccharide export LptBFGC system permease protein LptF
MKWPRAASWIYLALLAVGSVGMVVMFLLGPGSPTGEAAGLTYLYSLFAMLYMLPVILLVAAVEGLLRWHSGRKNQP